MRRSASSSFRCSLNSGISRRRLSQRQPSLEGDGRPDQVEHAEGPGASQEAIGRGRDASSIEGQHERMAAMLERVEHKYFAERQQAEQSQAVKLHAWYLPLEALFDEGPWRILD